ncbi:MAG: pyridoxine 5'-phosphate synthase, partial [Sphingobacteriaceae bacterium]
NHGWNTIEHQDYLKDAIAQFKEAGIRVSIFVDPVPQMVEAAATTGTDRIELYTESYAHHYYQGRELAIAPYVAAAKLATEAGLGINAGHDLSLENLEFFAKTLPGLDEVSIGHALICDALYYGLEDTVQRYLACLKP